MKTGEVKKQSLFSKLIDRIKHSTLFTMFFDPNSGMVVEPDEVDTHKQILEMAKDAGLSEKEAEEMTVKFDLSNRNLDGLIDQMTKIPEEPKESRNPFAVDEEDLIMGDDEGSELEKDEKDNSGRERE